MSPLQQQQRRRTANPPPSVEEKVEEGIKSWEEGMGSEGGDDDETGIIQGLYEEKLKEQLGNAPLKTLVPKDKVIWYAEPGNVKTSNSFNR